MAAGPDHTKGEHVDLQPEAEVVAIIERARAVAKPLGQDDINFLKEALAGYKKHGEELWGICRSALLYWTPRRLEVEALRRATDGTESSIAAMVSLLVELYLSWVPGQHALEANWIDPGRSSTGPAHSVLVGSFVRTRIHESLEMLERRAASVEARALDLRLRFDHQKLTAELFGKQLESTLSEAIRLALADTTTEPDLQRLVARLEQLSSIAPQLESLQKEVEFIADQAMAGFAERHMKPPALQRLKKLGEMSGSAGVKFGVTYVLKALTGQP